VRSAESPRYAEGLLAQFGRAKQHCDTDLVTPTVTLPLLLLLVALEPAEQRSFESHLQYLPLRSNVIRRHHLTSGPIGNNGTVLLSILSPQLS
jgi:hypothetical protein